MYKIKKKMYKINKKGYKGKKLLNIWTMICHKVRI